MGKKNKKRSLKKIRKPRVRNNFNVKVPRLLSPTYYSLFKLNKYKTVQQAYGDLISKYLHATSPKAKLYVKLLKDALRTYHPGANSLTATTYGLFHELQRIGHR